MVDSDLGEGGLAVITVSVEAGRMHPEVEISQFETLQLEIGPDPAALIDDLSFHWSGWRA